MLAFAWDMGYTPFSMESGLCLLGGLGLGAVLTVTSLRSERLSSMFTVFLFFILLDVFFLDGFWIPWLILAAALLLSFKFHERVPTTAFTAFALVFAGGLLFQNIARSGAASITIPESPTTPNSLIVHLLLDELGAFDSVPAEFRDQRDIDELAHAYSARGFRLFHGVHSTSPDTYKSMSSLMNNATQDTGQDFALIQPDNTYRLIQNKLHGKIANRDWTVSILQSWYMDYCTNVSSCFTYSLAGSAYAFERIGERSSRVQILAKGVPTSLLSRKRGLILMQPLRPLLAHSSQPTTTQWRNQTLPFKAMEQLDHLESALIEARGRHYVFAHILAPHFPWVLNRDCKTEDSRNWRLPYFARANRTPEARSEAFQAYWAQSVCVHKRVLELIDAVDAAHNGQAQFVIHGDHGPRIMARKLSKSHQRPQDEQTIRNLLSPFVAVRTAANGHQSEEIGANLQTLLFGILDRATADSPN